MKVERIDLFNFKIVFSQDELRRMVLVTNKLDMQIEEFLLIVIGQVDNVMRALLKEKE